jgi:hypothetical protein
MNSLILFFIIKLFTLPLLFRYGVSLYFTKGYKELCIRVYSI